MVQGINLREVVRGTNDNGASNAFGRRRLLKATTGVCLGVAAGTAGQVAAADEGETVEGELPYPDRGTMRVDDSVRGITPYYYLLTVGKDRLLELVDASDEPDRRKDDVRAFLKDAWRTYPVTRRRDGNDTVFSLAANRARGTADDDEDEAFTAAARAVRRGYASESDDVSAQWNGSNHLDMSEKTCDMFDMYDYQVEDVASHSDDPDDEPCDGCSADVFPGSWAMPNWVKDKIEQGLDEFAHHYGHYYDPNYYSYEMSGVSIEFNGIGAAPWYCEHEMDLAQQNDYYIRREHLGRALHYVQDVSVPLHSGMGIEQANLGLHCDWDGCAVIDPYTDEHYGYENYVSRNLTSGKEFLDDYDGIYVYNSDPVSVVQNCAEKSNDYSYEVFHLMLDNGTNPADWSSSSDRNDLDELTANCLAWGHGYAHALVNQLYEK